MPMLSVWVEELRQATTVEQVVRFASAHLARMNAAGEAPSNVANLVVEEAEDVRRAAALLARQPFMYNAPGYEGAAGQHLLILFSLATDRLAQLEGRGIARRSESPVSRAA